MPYVISFDSMRLDKITFATALSVLAYLPTPAQSLERVFIKSDKLIYQGRVITRSPTPGADSWTITVKKNGKILDKFEIGDAMSKDWAKLGLFSFLGGPRK